MEEFISICLSDGGKEFIGITKYGAILSNSRLK